MLNNQGHDRGHDQGNNRTFANQFNNPQGQGAFPLGGSLQSLHHNIPGQYNIQNRGLSGLSQAGSQLQQNRYSNQNLPSSLQYSQVGNRGGMSVLNGMNGPPNVPRGQGNATGMQAGRSQGAGLGLGPLGSNLQRQPAQNIAGLQRGMGNLGLGGGGSSHLGLQQMGSPARSNAMGLGYQTMTQQGLSNPNQPSGELLAMMNKSAAGGQLGNLGNLGQQFDRQHHHQQTQPTQNSVATSPLQNQDKEQPAFHDSEFPALGGALRASNAGLANGDRPSSIDGANLYASLGVHKGLLPSEFNIQSEEFPALPGATGRESESRQTDQLSSTPPSQVGHLKLQQGSEGQFPGQGQSASSGAQAAGQPAATQEQLLRFYQMHGRHQAGVKGGPANPLLNQSGRQQGGTQPSAQPDRFGLLGLLSVIRMTDPDLTTLALGTDLTTLGLHLNSSDNVYKTFAHPWADSPLRPEPEFSVPACYKQTPPRLKPGYFSKFQQDTLFYIFYSMPADEAQIFAADELASRGWGFNKELKAWMTRAPNTEPSLKTQQMEQGTYLIFDTSIWETVKKDMVLTYADIEAAPRLPRPGAQTPAPPPPQK